MPFPSNFYGKNDDTEDMPGDKPDMPGEKKPEMKPGEKKETIDTLAKDADAAGKLEPIKAALQKLGRDEVSPAEVLKLAQKSPQTEGKPVSEIAKMIEADEGLLDDLIAYKDGGVLAQRFGSKDEPTDEAPMPMGPGKTSDEVPA